MSPGLSGPCSTAAPPPQRRREGARQDVFCGVGPPPTPGAVEGTARLWDRLGCGDSEGHTPTLDHLRRKRHCCSLGKDLGPPVSSASGRAHRRGSHVEGSSSPQSTCCLGQRGPGREHVVEHDAAGARHPHLPRARHLHRPLEVRRTRCGAQPGLVEHAAPQPKRISQDDLRTAEPAHRSPRDRSQGRVPATPAGRPRRGGRHHQHGSQPARQAVAVCRVAGQGGRERRTSEVGEDRRKVSAVVVLVGREGTSQRTGIRTRGDAVRHTRWRGVWTHPSRGVEALFGHLGGAAAAQRRRHVPADRARAGQGEVGEGGECVTKGSYGGSLPAPREAARRRISYCGYLNAGVAGCGGSQTCQSLAFWHVGRAFDGTMY